MIMWCALPFSSNFLFVFWYILLPGWHSRNTNVSVMNLKNTIKKRMSWWKRTFERITLKRKDNSYRCVRKIDGQKYIFFMKSEMLLNVYTVQFNDPTMTSTQNMILELPISFHIKFQITYKLLKNRSQLRSILFILKKPNWALDYYWFSSKKHTWTINISFIYCSLNTNTNFRTSMITWGQ